MKKNDKHFTAVITIVQQVFKMEFLQSIFTNAEQRKLKI